MMVSHSIFSSLRLASFNVQGLASIPKREQFGRDMKQYRVDACAVQETKLKDAEDFKLPGRGTLRIFSQQKGVGGSQGGGIFIGPRLLPFLKVISRVNDPIAYAVLEIPKMQHPLDLVHAYGPTLPSCQQNSELQELF